METAEITKTTKRATLKQVVKAVLAYAKANNESFTQIKECYHTDALGKPEIFFEAYINGFGIFSRGQTVSEIIKLFDDVKSGKAPSYNPPADLNDDLDLPF